MSEPYWEPLAAVPAASGALVPPVVNGQWLKGVGGAAVWTPLAIVNADVAAGAAIDGAKINPAFAGPISGKFLTLQPGASQVAGITMWNTANTTATSVLQRYVDDSVYLDSPFGDLWLRVTGHLIYFSGTQVKANGMSVHRHPYTTDRHIEAGRVSVGPGAVLTCVFTSAFSSTPNVTLMSEGAGGAYCALEGAPSTTQCRIWNPHPSSALAIDWIAEGPN